MMRASQAGAPLAPGWPTRRAIVCAAWLAALVFTACGTGGSAAPGPEALFANGALRAHAEAAPELLREAEATLARARSERDPEVAADLATEARLLFLAAAAEGERRLLSSEAGGRALEPDAADDAATRRYALAVALASTEAEAVTEAARELEATRWRSREETLVSSRRAAFEIVVARARILLGALAGPGRGEPSEVAAFGGRLEQLRGRRDPTEALDSVDRLRRELEARLSRAGDDGAGVLAAATRAGLSVEPIDGLWVVELELGAGRSPAPAAVERAKRMIASLGARSFLLVAEGPPRGRLERVLEASEAALAEAGVERAAMTSLAVTSSSFPAPRLTMRFVGYPTP